MSVALNITIYVVKTPFTIEINKQRVSQANFFKRISYIPDTPLIYDLLTGEENIHFLLNLWKIENKKLFYNKLHKMLKDFHLDQDVQKLVANYSLGMKNKLFFICNIARDPEILLLDEPLTSFDLESQEKAIQLLKKREEEKKVILFSSHIKDLFMKLARRVYVLDEGHLYLHTNVF